MAFSRRLHALVVAFSSERQHAGIVFTDDTHEVHSAEQTDRAVVSPLGGRPRLSLDIRITIGRHAGRVARAVAVFEDR